MFCSRLRQRRLGRKPAEPLAPGCARRQTGPVTPCPRPARLVLAAEHERGREGCYDCIKAFSETDPTEDLKKIDVPMLIIHGDDDQIVPIGASALLSSKIVKDATLKVYPGAPHGLAQTTAWKDEFNTDLLNFIKS